MIPTRLRRVLKNVHGRQKKAGKTLGQTKDLKIHHVQKRQTKDVGTKKMSLVRA
jgi:hypothetical protein